MTLPEVLHDAIRRVRCDAIVTFARAGEHANQVRFMPDRTVERGYRASGRRWIVETGWSPWLNFLGFSIDGAIAIDWKILVVEER